VFENSQNLARFGSSVRKGGKPYEGRHSAKAEKPIGSRATLRSASVAIAHSCGGQAHERRALRSCENIRGNGGTARARRVRPLERRKPTGAWAEFAA
jgi:DnaJ-class molecular chaperone